MNFDMKVAANQLRARMGVPYEIDQMVDGMLAAAEEPRCTAEEREVLDRLYQESPCLRDEGIDNFDGEYVHWNEIIDAVRDDPACGGGYSESPIELIQAIVNDRDDIKAERDALAAEVVRLRSALQFYAEGKHFRADDYISPGRRTMGEILDTGWTAKAALAPQAGEGDVR